ncbi:hypothetical protein EKO27_g4264 [Xylaria grammica]|uniref:Uncharacterized protein n=1 Tax=Xylaria grammica TaxID=363999 RepID=A0A439D8V9_9PEZI|nr:hypothetical protein EKO27_g4264 [Xylaria grammica]
MCRGNKTSVYLDTGYIDSNHHLGLNLPENRGFAYRYVLSCSPIETEGYTTTSSVGNKSAIIYHYGGLHTSNGSILDYTFESEDLDIQYYEKDFHGMVPSHNFKVTVIGSATIGGTVGPNSLFIPNPELSRSDGDVSIVFLAGNGVIFSELMDDQWYRATIPAYKVSRPSDPNHSTIMTYMPKEAASPLGCVEQSQWCNTAYSKESGCGPLASFYDSYVDAAVLFNLTEKDLSLTRDDSEDKDRIGSLGAKSLSSQSKLEGGTQYRLPQNQWQLDVTNWWNGSLAHLQSVFVDTAIGTTIPTAGPLNDEERNLCNSQKILSTEYSSFNLFALLVTYITGGLIIILSYISESLLDCLSRRRKWKQYEFLEWTTHESLQLHRLAHENVSPGNWIGGANKVPITTANAMLAHLDISNPEHPVLVRPEPKTPQTARNSTW